jgi:hypothetical protein
LEPVASVGNKTLVRQKKPKDNCKKPFVPSVRKKKTGEKVVSSFRAEGDHGAQSSGDG